MDKNKKLIILIWIAQSVSKDKKYAPLNYAFEKKKLTSAQICVLDLLCILDLMSILICVQNLIILLNKNDSNRSISIGDANANIRKMLCTIEIRKK